jgi:hypothetical protein
MNKQQIVEILQKENPHSIPVSKAMDVYAEQFAYDFAKFLEEHTEVIREEKITLYRYNSPHDGWGNYTLEDILIEFKEKYEG